MWLAGSVPQLPLPTLRNDGMTCMTKPLCHWVKFSHPLRNKTKIEGVMKVSTLHVLYVIQLAFIKCSPHQITNLVKQCTKHTKGISKKNADLTKRGEKISAKVSETALKVPKNLVGLGHENSAQYTPTKKKTTRPDTLRNG